MGRIIPTDIRDPFEQAPPGWLLLEVTGAGEGMVGKEGEEVYGLQVEHTIVEPATVAGVEHNETFFIGVNEKTEAVKRGKLKADPEANNPETWQARAGNFKRYASKFEINVEGADLDLVFQELMGKRIMAHIIHAPSKTLREDGTPFINARVDRWVAVGEVKPELEEAHAIQPAKPAAPVPGPRLVGAAPSTAGPAPAARPALRRLSK